MQEYEKTGYLNSDFRLFHISDSSRSVYEFHYHDFHKIILFLQGDVDYCIEGQTYRLEPYDIILVKAGELHRPVINSPAVYERIILYISDQYLHSFDSGEQSLHSCFEKAGENRSHVLRMGAPLRNSRLFQIPKELEDTLKRPDFGTDLLAHSLLGEFLVLLNRTALHNSMDFIPNNYSNSKILSVLEYLNSHLEDDISIDLLAERFFISKYHLMRLFREETGYTICNYLSMKRLLKARSMITSGTAITEVCFACGFRNYSTFSRAYKKYFSVSPRENR